MSGAKYQIILVHGTFAKGASWSAEGSEFRQQLQAALGGDVTLSTFGWSGHNNHAARLQAGTQLTQSILEHASTSSRTLVVVAHSHGGNVALYSLRDDSARGVVKGVVCMGTPFLSCSPRKLKDSADVLRYIVAGFAALWSMILGIGFLVFGFFSLGRLPNMGWIDGPLPVILCSLYLLLDLCPRIAKRTYSWVESSAVRLDLRGRRLMHRIVTPVLPNLPILCLTTTGDEAGSWLTGIEAVGNLPYKLWNIKIFFGLYALVSVTNLLTSFRSSTLPSWSAEQTFYFVGSSLLQAVVGTAFLLLVLQGVMISVPRIVRAPIWGFGGETFFDNWLLRIRAIAVPTGCDACEEQILNLPGSGLKHSRFYSQKITAEAIGEWIIRKLEQS